MKKVIFKTIKQGAAWSLAHPGEVFLVLALIFGVLICFRIEPLSGTDEFTHFSRTYQIASGSMWEQKISANSYGGLLPQNIKLMIDDYRDLSRKPTGEIYRQRARQLNAYYGSQKDEGKQKPSADFTSAAVYPPWSFLPSAGGVFMARILHLPLVWYIYLSRLVTLVTWIILVWFAIKFLPHGKWFLVVVALLPTSLTQAATIGIDGLVMGISWLLIALVLAVLAGRISLKKWSSLGVLLSGLALSLVKQGYVLVAALPFIIPLRYFITRRYGVMWKVGLGVGLLLVNGWLLLFTRNVTSVPNLSARSNAYVNSHDQLLYVLHHLGWFLERVLTQPFTKSYDTVYLGLVGIVTNRLIYLPVLMIGVLYLGLFMSLADTPKLPQLRPARYWLLGSIIAICLVTYLGISLALYLEFTPVGSPVVEGISGRYFLPLLPLTLILPLAYGSKIKMDRLTYSVVVPVIITIALICTLASLNT